MYRLWFIFNFIKRIFFLNIINNNNRFLNIYMYTHVYT